MIFMKYYSFVLVFLVFFIFTASSQEKSFIVLGDIHYDLIDDHDMEWLNTKPDDLRQVKEYSQITEEIWPTFSKHLKEVSRNYLPEVKAVLQLGDISEGLAGSEEKADQMARNLVRGVDAVDMQVPWIIIKGNHDITGPGAVDAFNKHYVPMFQKQLNNKNITSANYSHQIGENFFVAFDPWDRRDDLLDILEENLSKSDAKFKFLLVHEPIIPINERCWHLYRSDSNKRERLLEIVAKNRAIVLTAHLHLYAIVKRETEYGPIIQLSLNSVVRDLKRTTTDKVKTTYDWKLAADNPQWQPETLAQRAKWLDEESKHVTFFKQQELPGFGIITTNSEANEIFFEYYSAISTKPYERICLSDLYK
jgi:UDP-2,3-diacylglucosamine pyrophosphatase LpxH